MTAALTCRLTLNLLGIKSGDLHAHPERQFFSFTWGLFLIYTAVVWISQTESNMVNNGTDNFTNQITSIDKFGSFYKCLLWDFLMSSLNI